MDDERNDPSDVPAGDDPVALAVSQARRDLAERRARGELPELPLDELDQQFGAVVEAVEAGIIEQPPLDPGDLNGPAVLETWRPMAGKPGVAARLVGLALSPLSRVVGVVVRKQVGDFSRRTAQVVEELASRQNRILFFLSKVHLDRQRRLEYRVAELEREVTALRARLGEPAASGSSGSRGD